MVFIITLLHPHPQKRERENKNIKICHEMSVLSYSASLPHIAPCPNSGTNPNLYQKTNKQKQSYFRIQNITVPQIISFLHCW